MRFHYKHNFVEMVLAEMIVKAVESRGKELAEFVGDAFLRAYRERKKIEGLSDTEEKVLKFIEEQAKRVYYLTREKADLSTIFAKKMRDRIEKFLLLLKEKEKQEKKIQQLKETLERGDTPDREAVEKEIKREERILQTMTEIEERLQKGEEVTKQMEDLPSSIFNKLMGLTGEIEEKDIKEGEEKIKQFAKGAGIHNPSQTEQIALALIYDAIDEDVSVYLGEILEGLGERTIELHPDPTTKDTGRDITRIRKENFVDEVLFEKRLAEESIYVKGLTEEENAGYGSFALLIDRSGSMFGESLLKAKAVAIYYILQAYSKKIPIVIVAFDDFAEGRKFHMKKTEDIREAVKYVSDIRVGGGTGYTPAIEEAEKLIREEKMKADLLMISDGAPHDSPPENHHFFKTKVFVGVDVGLDKEWEDFFNVKVITNKQRFHKDASLSLDDIVRGTVSVSGGIKP